MGASTAAAATRTNANNKDNNNKVCAKLIESAFKVQICALIYGVCFEVINDCDDEWQQ